MPDPLDTEIAALEQHLSHLYGRRADREATQQMGWPRRATIYAHRAREANLARGEALGLTGEALRRFVHFTEVALDVAVEADGTVTVLACDGRRCVESTV